MYIRELAFAVTHAEYRHWVKTTRLVIEPLAVSRDIDPLEAGQWVRHEPGDLVIALSRIGEGWCEIDDWEALLSTGHITGPCPTRMVRLTQLRVGERNLPQLGRTPAEQYAYRPAFILFCPEPEMTKPPLRTREGVQRGVCGGEGCY